MKKILFLAAIAVLGLSNVNAQEETTTGGFANGDVFVTGAVTFGSQSTGDDKVNSLVFAPRVGYFVSDNIAVGLGLGLTTGKEEDPNGEVKTTGFGVEGFGRYYFTPANQFSLFAELAVSYNSFETEFSPIGFPSSESDFAVIGAQLGAGLNYFVSSNFSIEAGVAVLGFSSNDNGGGSGVDSTDTFSFGGDWTAVTFGVNYKF